MYPQSLQLRPWEPVSQLRTWAPDETYSNERIDECGQTALVMCFRYSSGLWVPSAYLHDLVHSTGEVTGTTLQQIVQTCTIQSTRATIHYPKTENDVQQLIVSSINNGYPLIPLRWFDHVGNYDSQQNAVLHYTCITGYTPSLVQQAGPWSGTMFTETWEQFMNMYYGGIVVFERKRKLGDH